MNNNLVTLDVDWAPDFMISFSLRALLENQVKSTWFITHESPILEELRDNSDLVELGVHPNFLSGSSHGEKVDEVLDYVMRLVPGANCVRAHGVVQSGSILSDFVRLAALRVDATIFLPEMPGIQPVKHLTPYGELLRIPTFWADDYEILKDDSEWNAQRYMGQQGLKMFNFHPIHIYLNTKDNAHYNDFRNSGVKLNTATPDDVEPFINKGVGVRDFFLELVSRNDVQGKFLREFLS